MEPHPLGKRLNRIIHWGSFLILAICFVLIGIDRAATQAAQPSPLRPLTLTLYEWAILGSAFVLLAGGFNIIWSHFQRIIRGGPEWPLSLLMLVVMFAVLAMGLLDRAGTASMLVDWVFAYVISPLQASIFALLALFLATAAYRYLRIGHTGGGWMLAGALVMFLMQLPLLQGVLNQASLGTAPRMPLSQVEATLRWLIQWPVQGVMRGAVIGAAVSLLLIAFRFLFGYRA